MGNNRLYSLQIFLILFPIIFLIQFSLLNIILKYGFTADDWLLLFDYKTIGSGDVLEKIFAIVRAKGLYTSYQVLYIGLLESLFKSNYLAYQISNIVFKALATLSLFSLILVVFKNRLLAFLTTILYAISYSSTGALQFVVKGSDYLAIFFMNLFMIGYYYSFKTKRKSLLFITAVLLFLTFIFSPIRMYPLLLLIFLAEIIIWARIKGLLGLVTALLRLALLFSPFLIMLLLFYKSTGNYLNGPLVVFRFISYGNYQLLLTPFAGLGYTFLPNDYWPIFGKLNLDNFREYMFFLIHGPIIIYSILTILLGFLITKKHTPFILAVIVINIVFEIICYFFITNLRGAVGPNVKGFYPISTYAIFFGFFCLSVAFSSLIIWLRTKSNILFLSLFAGPIFSSIFLWGTWLVIGDSLTFKEGIHWYLIIPPIGTSLFLASLIVLIFTKIKNIVNINLRYALISGLFLVILSVYLISRKEINSTFSYLLHIGYGASDQEEIKSNLLSHLRSPLNGNSTLFYLDTSEDLQDSLFYPVTLISGFEKRMHFRNWEIVNGCIGLIYDRVTLEKSIVRKDGIKGFSVSSLCVDNNSFAENSQVFYKPENFYAFKVKHKEVIDIKAGILKNYEIR